MREAPLHLLLPLGWCSHFPGLSGSRVSLSIPFHTVPNAFLGKGKHKPHAPFDALQVLLRGSRGVSEILSFLHCLNNLALLSVVPV